MHKRNTMGDLERVVYDLAEAGALTRERARLYPRPVGKLMRAGLLAKAPDGALRPSTAPPALEPERAPVPPPMATLVVRVPQEWLDTLDAQEGDRSTAAREALARGLGRRAPSGTMRKVGT